MSSRKFIHNVELLRFLENGLRAMLVLLIVERREWVTELINAFHFRATEAL